MPRHLRRVLPVLFLLAGCERQAAHQPEALATHVSVTIDARSEWALTSQEGSLHLQDTKTGLLLTIDYTDAADDGSYAGLYFSRDGIDFAGAYGGGRAAFLIPDIALTQDALSVQGHDSVLTVVMQGQSYGDIAPTGNRLIDRQPITFKATIISTPGVLHLDLLGMYYVLLPRSGTFVGISSAAGDDSLTITPSIARVLRYYPDASKVMVSTRAHGRWLLSTDARVLQLDVPDSSQKAETLFELDFDHSYKDAGQMQVHTTADVTFDNPGGQGRSDPAPARNR